MIDRRFRSQVTIDDRHDEQRRDGGEHQAADHGASERRILLAAFAKPSAIGSMPRIIAVAVISTGRMRA